MNIITGCPECPRQYRADHAHIGSAFFCHCGARIVVAPPKGHEAAVIRCSSCGAVRQGAAAHCTFCRSDFTLHEQDLTAVCPECLARIGGRAKFCHHCGTSIDPEHVFGEATELPCPVCGPSALLQERTLGGAEPIHLMECFRCAGMWLSRKSFEDFTSRAQKKAHHESLAELFPSTFVLEAKPAQGGPFYRACPSCQARMWRRNFGKSSGILIDQCAKHGFWFDCNELAAIFRWVRDGGLTENEGNPRGTKAPIAPLKGAGLLIEVEEKNILDEVLKALGRLL